MVTGRPNRERFARGRFTSQAIDLFGDVFLDALIRHQIQGQF
jgi:hypothetical protein